MLRSLTLATLLLWTTMASAADHVVTVNNLKFDPKSIDIKPGDTVTWKNEDERDYTVVSDDKSFKAGKLPPGATFKAKFEKAGKFSYHCDLHPRMKGAVVVKESK